MAATVATNIMKSSRSWSEGIDIRGPGSEFTLRLPDQVGEQVVHSIRHNIFFLPTDPLVRDRLVRRASDMDGHLREEIAHPQIIAPAGGTAG